MSKGDESNQEGDPEIEVIDEPDIKGWLQVLAMIILIITMIVLAIIIFKYGSAIKSNPCNFCNCTLEMVKGGWIK